MWGLFALKYEGFSYRIINRVIKIDVKFVPTEHLEVFVTMVHYKLKMPNMHMELLVWSL